MSHAARSHLLTWILLAFSLCSCPSGSPTAAKPEVQAPTPQIAPVQQPEDGLYLVLRQGEGVVAGPGELSMDYDLPRMPQEAPKRQRLILSSSPVVLMALTKTTKADFTPDTCGNVSFEFAPEAAEALADATELNVGGRMAIVLDGQVVTAHKIKTRIEGGKVSVSCCAPEACARLQEVLTHHVVGRP